MRLFEKVTLTLCVTLIASTASAILAVSLIFLPQYENMDRDAALATAQRVQEVFKREQKRTEAVTADWGNWQDTRTFSLDLNQDYISNNLTAEALASLHVDELIVADLDGKTIFDYRSPNATKHTSTFSSVVPNGLHSVMAAKASLLPRKTFSGLVTTPWGPIIVAMTRITDSQYQNAPDRVLILVKDVDADFISAINEQSGSMFALRQIKPESASSELIAKTITGTDNGYDVSIPMTDPRGSQSYILNIRSPTTFYGLAVNTIALVAFILLVIGVLTAVVLAIFMRVAVASPLEQIIRHTDQVSKTGNLDRRLNYNRKDEIGILAQSYDGMLEQLKQARIQVQEMSYAAGISNTAADMLHNIRNSLTPISTALWKGKESLAAMKVARLSQAGNELADGQTEPGRRSRLAAFVSATATHLEAQRAAAEKEFGVIQDFSGQIENVLSHHEELSRGSIVPEAVSLQDIFESARRLIETTSRLPIRVLIASETSHLPHVLAQRVVLRQIMENLVVNAIESIEEQKPETGILALAATSLPDKVEIAITDNGVGIPAEAINSIFSRGVSTKGQSGRGLGLHYSATSVRAMNGNISAESAGPGQGATFRISLPLSADTELVA